MVPISKRCLSKEEISSLKVENYTDLRELSSRYLPELEIEKGLPGKPEYLDVLRTSWLLDTSPDRPAIASVVRGLGYALGLLIHQRLGLEWSRVQDEQGEHISMVGKSESGSEIFVPPFAYVEKKGDFPNAEVFVDLFRVIAQQMAKRERRGWKTILQIRPRGRA
jgi:hypothetical protein